jgi:hypothetical protein
MIEQENIQRCRVTGEVKFDEDGRIALPLKNKGSRKCIFGPEHNSNNSYLFVKQDYVHYGCLSKKCKQRKPRVLGRAPQSWRDWRTTNHEVSKRQKTEHHDTTDITSRMIPIDTSRNEMMIKTDPSPVTDTSSGTGFADMSAAVETEDEKEQALHCDQYNENLTDIEDDFEVDVGDEYAEMEEEEMLVRALPSATVSASTTEAMSLNDSTAPIGVSEPAAASAVELTEEQKERIARASTDGISHMSRYIANATPFHHVTDHESSGLLASHQMIKKQKTQPTTDVVPRPVTRIPSETDFGDESNIMANDDENEQDPEVSFAAEGNTDSNVSEEGRLRRDMAQMSMRLAEIEAAKCYANASLESADYTDEDASGASTDGRGHMDRDISAGAFRVMRASPPLTYTDNYHRYK